MKLLFYILQNSSLGAWLNAHISLSILSDLCLDLLVTVKLLDLHVTPTESPVLWTCGCIPEGHVGLLFPFFLAPVSC